MPALTQAGIVVTNTPDVLTETSADFGFALMMAATRRITEAERWLRDGQWRQWSFETMLGGDVHGTTLGILGMGRIGQGIARRASGFRMRVLYHNRSRLPETVERELGARYVDFDALLAQADHLLLVLPYSPASQCSSWATPALSVCPRRSPSCGEQEKPPNAGYSCGPEKPSKATAWRRTWCSTKRGR